MFPGATLSIDRVLLDLGECGKTCYKCPIGSAKWGREVSASPLNHLLLLLSSLLKSW